VAVKFRDYYEVLGVPRTASENDIKKAFRKLARETHPDLKPPGERARAAERFKEINEANEVLSDPEKRRKYDALGPNWKNGMDFTPPPGWSGGAWRSGGGPGEAGPDFEGFGDFSDFFESIFGHATRGARAGRGARGNRGGTRVQFPGSDVEAELPVTTEDLLKGGKRRITLGNRTIDVEIPLGVRDGTGLRLAGQGEPGMGGGPTGDLYLRLRLVQDPRHRIVGDDIEMDLPLWPWQAVLGSEVMVDTPEGRVKLNVPPGTPSGRRLRLRGRGLPRQDGTRGDLYAVIRIAVPERPSEAEKAAYEALKRASSNPTDRPAEG
jgi:curved DNA-binding protein